MTLRSCSSLMSSCSLPESTNELSKEWSGQGTSGDWTSVSQPRCTGRVRGGAEVEWTTATALVWGMGELAIWYISQASKSWGDEKKDERYLPGRQQQWLLPPLLLPDGILAELSVSGASIPSYRDSFVLLTSCAAFRRPPVLPWQQFLLKYRWDCKLILNKVKWRRGWKKALLKHLKPHGSV